MEGDRVEMDRSEARPAAGSKAGRRGGSTRGAALLLIAAQLLFACSGGGGEGPRALSDEPCGFPSPSPGMPDTKVPEDFLIEGSRISSGQKVAGGFVTTIDIPYSVQDALPVYREAVADAGFKLHNVDNEGFEAELYFEGDDQLGAIQIRRSTCPDASLVYVNLVSRESLTKPGKGFD